MSGGGTIGARGHDERTYGIDVLRGVACLSVVAFHYLSRGPNAGFMAVAALPALEHVARYGYLGVHLFFMVSGYVILMSAIGRTPREFVASRIARLYPALWVAATLTMAFVWLRHDTRFLVTWPEYLWNLTLVPQYVGARFVDGAYWSLAVELQFYILVWLLLRTGAVAHVEASLWPWLALAFVDALRPTYLLERWLVVNWAPLFILGATTFLVASRGWTRARAALIVTSIIVGLWHSRIEAARLTRIEAGEGPDAAIVAVLLLAGAAIFLLIGLGTIRMKRSALATVPGKLTYPVYLVHQVAGYLLFGILVQRIASPVAALLLTVAGALLTGALLHVFVERPLGPRLRRIIASGRRGDSPPSRPPARLAGDA